MVLLGSLIGWSWVVWLILLIIILIGLWVFTSKNNRQFIGLSPLAPPVAHNTIEQDPTHNIDDFTRVHVSQFNNSTPFSNPNFGNPYYSLSPHYTSSSSQQHPTRNNSNQFTTNNTSNPSHSHQPNSHISNYTNRHAPVSVIRNDNSNRSFDMTRGQLARHGLPVISGFSPQTPGQQTSLENEDDTNGPPTPVVLITPRTGYAQHPILVTPENNNLNFISLSSYGMTDPEICTGRSLPDSYNIDFSIYPNPQDDSKFECACRQVLEQIYGVKFPKVRPPFLHGKELDGAALDFPLKFALNGQIIEYKGIAFEANGIQHYEWPNFTGQPIEDFYAQVKRDDQKLEECDNEGIYVITIPYTVTEQVKGYDLIPRWIEYFMIESVIARRQAEARGETVIYQPPAPLPTYNVTQQ